MKIHLKTQTHDATPLGSITHSETIISLQGVTKRYSRFQALHDITVEIPAGVTGLLGPNGAGKSTLIKILLGLLRATSGTGTVLGLPIGFVNSRIREHVGYMPEDDCYIPGLSGIESVQFAARLNNFEPREALRRGHEILDFCGAGQERYRNVETYSTGMRQKLKFAQALVHDPPLLILDEPTSGLDPDEREAMLKRIRLLSTRHRKSVVICTHILPDIQQVSDHVVVLSAGRVAVSDSLESLSKPESPAMHVRTVGESQRFAQILSDAGLECIVSNVGTITIASDAPEIIRSIWRLAASNGIAIQSLAPAKNSMESIFLSAVQSTRGGNDAAV